MAETKTKDLGKRMIEVFRVWYQERFGVPLQYSSQQAYVIEYNTMKGMINMLRGTYRAKNPGSVPDDDTIFGMWERILAYLKEKNNYCYTSLLSLHRNYNNIIAQLMRHNEKVRAKQKTASAKENEMNQRINIIQQMMQNVKN